MKLTTTTQLLLTGIITTTIFLIPQLAKAQLPTIVDGTQPSETPNTATTRSGIVVRCQDLKTVVQKGDRQAVMVTWSSGFFGKEFTPAKRCKMVSERLQQAANLNGGTFQGLQLASGTVNSFPVICALPNGNTTCDRQNLLFTLKPENARNPEAVIQKIFKFAEDGSSSINESSDTRPKIDLSLGNWERKAFSPSVNIRRVDTGF